MPVTLPETTGERLRYAAYGSNLHPLRLRARLPSAELIGTGRIDDYSVHFHKRGMDGSAKCDIVAGGDAIHVAVFEIAADDALRLDEFEGPGYRSQTIEVGGFGECFIYVARSTHIDRELTPFTWYRDLVVAGCEYLGFPHGYTGRIARVSACRDPDAERHARHAALLESARAIPPLRLAPR